MSDNLKQVRLEIIKHIVNSFHIKEFIADTLYATGLKDSKFQNAKGMFAWNKPYSEVEKMEQIFDGIIVFHANTNAWKFPLIYDEKTQIIFLLMSENNLNQKRKQKITEINPPHYSKILSEINQPYSNQISLLPKEVTNPIPILNKFITDERINTLPEGLKLAIVSCQHLQGDLLKVTCALFDKNLLLIDNEVDWSSYIDLNYDSDNITTKLEQKIQDVNANTLVMNTLKENLISLKQDVKINTTTEI